MKSGREIYLQFFRYYYYLKNKTLSQIFSYISFKNRRKKLCIIKANRVSFMAESLKENIKLEENEKSIEFCFYNQPFSISLEDMKWELKDYYYNLGEYWIKELNSFDYLNSDKENHINEQQANFLVLDWISKNTNERSENWGPYTLSKRLTAWVKWLNKNNIPSEITPIIKLSISLQLKRLFIDMEYHKPANHLLENIRGYLFGCSSIINSSQYFNNETEYQLEKVLGEAIKQLNIQILDDGGHFERSPFYHLLMLEAVKDIKDLAKLISKQGFLIPEILEKSIKLVGLCEEKIEKMTKWLEIITMSDGYIAQFNDSSRFKGLKHSFDNLTELLESSGFFVRHKNNNSFILSCSSPSPTFLPEHSHCDILSYELSINGKLAIIDSGCSGYENETLRLMSRETEAHNLPMVQHHDQSDIWGMFEFGKRAQIRKRLYNDKESKLELSIEDQFGQIINRNILFTDNSIEISDFLIKRRMEGCFISLIHLVPELEPIITQNDNNTNIITCKMTNESKFSIITKANVRVSDYISFPDFGKSVGAKMLILSNKEAEELSYVIKW